MLHPGHVRMIQYAQMFGSRMVVGVDSDGRVRLSKPGRPIQPLAWRMEVVKALKCVDKVVSYDTDSELRQQIADSGASIIVVGSDWKGKPVVGEELVDRVEFFDRVPGFSTSRIVQFASRR